MCRTRCCRDQLACVARALTCSTGMSAGRLAGCNRLCIRRMSAGEKWHYAPMAVRLAQAGVLVGVVSYTLYPQARTSLRAVRAPPHCAEHAPSHVRVAHALPRGAHPLCAVHALSFDAGHVVSSCLPSIRVMPFINCSIRLDAVSQSM